MNQAGTKQSRLITKKASASLLGARIVFRDLFAFLSRRGIATKLSYALIAAAIISGFATYAALTEAPPFGDNPDIVIWLLNIDLVILLLLTILIARRIINIWSGRRQKIAGSQLHVRLVIIFSVMAALPAIIMAVFSAFFFHFGVQTWFSENVRTAVVESQAVATAYLEEHKQVIRADILAMANDIDRNAPFILGDGGRQKEQNLTSLMDTQSFLRNFSESMILGDAGQIIARSSLTFTLTFEGVPNYILSQARDGDVVILTNDAEDRVRALVKLDNWSDSYLYVGRRIDPVVLGHLEATQEASARYNKLEGSYSDLQVTVTMIFIVVALLLMLAAIWVGIVLARQLVMPISTLISVSDRVRGGDLSARVPAQKQIEEFDYLANSFNRMTEQIEGQRNDLIDANRLLDQRRRLTETVLAGVSAGVVGVDEAGEITFTNNAAMKLFESEKAELAGQNITDIIPECAPYLDKAHKHAQKITQFQMPYKNASGKNLELNIRIAIELIGENEQGAILTFDDITALQSAQKKAAWSDVARRIAHEIKNPLTPIQLSAERLQRKYSGEITSDPETFEVCTQTIIRHVEDIGRMVSEFSDFARLPEAILSVQKIDPIIRDAIMLHKQAHSKVKITYKNNVSKAAKIDCDAAQLRQALNNLIQNSIDSIHMRDPDKPQVKVMFDVFDNQGAIIVCDNGKGLPDEVSNLTEPYVTFRDKGTGLGLAIVKKIMEDHGGKIVMGEAGILEALPAFKSPQLDGASVALIFPFNQEALS